jgi:L-aspartate oxidase
MTNNTIETDILVVGSGLAGAIAALTAAEENKKVILITNSNTLLSGNTRWAQGGIVYSPNNRSQEILKDDIYTAGGNDNHIDAVNQLVSIGPKLIEEILIDKIQIPFEKDSDGQLLFTSEAAHSDKSIIHCKDATGLTIHQKIIEKLSQHPQIIIYTQHTAVDLLTYSHHSISPLDIYEEPACFGAIILHHKTNQLKTIIAKNTILATGGLGQLYLHSTNPAESRGDGIAMAWRAGARCVNLHYIQFHPTALYHESGRFLISEALRGEGAKLYDINGSNFMESIHSLQSLAPRDIVARGIHEALIKTQHPCVYLDISHKQPKWIKDRFPTIYKHCLKVGIDITLKPIPVVPAAHYSCGGISVNLKGESSLNRLYAIGEVSCTGTHGSNRLASTSLLECLVWGYLSGKNAANDDQNYSIPQIKSWVQASQEIDSALIAQDWLIIKNTMWNYVGLVRTRERLHRAQLILRNLQHDIEQFYQTAKLTPEIIGLRNGIQAAVAITNAALEDRVSRGCHYVE